MNALKQVPAKNDSGAMAAMMDLINRSEKEFPVADWGLNQVRVWPLLRWYLGWSFYPSTAQTPAHAIQKQLRRVKSVFDTFVPYGWAYLSDFKHNSSPNQAADVFFLASTVERQTIAGRKFNVIFDPLIEILKSRDRKSLVWEWSSMNQYQIPRYSPSAFIQPQLFFMLFSRKRKSREWIQKNEEHLNGYAEFLSFLACNGARQYRYADLNLLREDFAYIRLLADFYKNEFQNIKPLLAVSANGGLNEFALNLACRELGIPSVEIQHGVQGELHFGYGRWQNVPETGYEMLPRFFWCWDEESAAAINQWALPQAPHAHQAIVGGNVGLDLWLKDKTAWNDFYDHRMSELKRVRSAKRYILVTLQSPEMIYDSGELISEFILESMKKSPSDWCWWVRLRPIMMKSKGALKRLLEAHNIKNYELEYSSGFPLPALLKHVDVHVTHSSSTVLDAEMFGVPSVVWSPWSEELYQKQVLAGIAKPAYNAPDFLRAVENQFDFKIESGQASQASPEETIQFLLNQGLDLEKKYQQCARCVLDTSVLGITFDSEGICHYCRDYDKTAKNLVLLDEKKKEEKLNQILSQIKNSGRHKRYDSLIGLSGGADSSYLVYLAHQLGLRPLIVHFDNGWNSETSVRNVKSIVTKLGFELYTYVIHWEEFKDLQRSYLKASVVDVEVPTDQLIMGSLYRIAFKKGIKYILDGCNVVTEQVMPRKWNYSLKLDPVNLKNIHRQYGTLKLRNFPQTGLFHRLFYEKILGIKVISLLNYMPYVKKEAKEVLRKEFGWQDYGGKHFESIFTRFYQGYILPRKFGIDKRKAHLSTLICSGQLAKHQALAELANEPYSKEEQSRDKEYVIKKLGFSESEFDALMREPARDHSEFGSEVEHLKHLRFFVRKILRIKRSSAPGTTT